MMIGPGSLNMLVKQRPPRFAESCLPLTSEMANIAKDILAPVLKDLPREWGHLDRVLALIAPSLRPEIERFHEDGERAMTDIFQSHQIEHFDQDILGAICERIESLSPGFLDAVRQLLGNKETGQ